MGQSSRFCDWISPNLNKGIRIMARGVWLVGLLASLIFSGFANAADVVKAQGKGVLINLSGEPANVGDSFYLVNASGKKKAIIKIVKLRKGDQAIGKVTAG